MNYLYLASIFVLFNEAQFCLQMRHSNFSLVTIGLSLLFISHWCLCLHRLLIKYICVIELQNSPLLCPRESYPQMWDKTGVKGFEVPTGMTECCHLVRCDVVHCSINLVNFEGTYCIYPYLKLSTFSLSVDKFPLHCTASHSRIRLH
jgi:hypothetical protein